MALVLAVTILTIRKSLTNQIFKPIHTYASIIEVERSHFNIMMSVFAVSIPSPGVGGAVCPWRLWSRDSVQAPPLCRYSGRLHPELSCTPANPPSA